MLDQVEADRLALEAFDGALEEFMADGVDPERIEMVAAHTPDRLRDMLRTGVLAPAQPRAAPAALEPTVAPLPAGEADRLETAARVALEELGGGAASATVAAAIESLDAAIDLLGDDRIPDGAELTGIELKGRSKAVSTQACEDYKSAFNEYRSFVLARQEQRDHKMLSGLLELFGERYERAKRERSGLDFEDLELVARDLLAGDAGLREAYAERFAHVLVDEFQDTNPLQNELLELLARDNLFRVGDENQSIYRFRNADVGVFRSHWDDAVEGGRAESITVNFRARGEILDAIDLAFMRTWGQRFEPLREAPGRASRRRASTPASSCWSSTSRASAGTRRPASATPRSVDALHRAALAGGGGAPAGQARRRAHRDGPYGFGDVVMLFRATTAMGFFERALEERGIPVHVVGGRGYFAQQQVSDLRHWLSALANPLDGLAVYSLLALAARGPLARRGRADRPARAALAPRPVVGRERAGATELVAVLPDQDRRRLAAFVDRFEAERRVAGQVALETLIDRAVTGSGYDRHLLALPGGIRRMANVRKLMRMAREFEADEGRDLRGFVDAWPSSTRSRRGRARRRSRPRRSTPCA